MQTDEEQAQRIEDCMTNILELKCGCEGRYVGYRYTKGVGVRLTRKCKQHLWRGTDELDRYVLDYSSFKLPKDELVALLEKLDDDLRE